MELAERQATLQLQKAEATTAAVRLARTELRRLANAQREASAAAAATTAAVAHAPQVCVRAVGCEASCQCASQLSMCWLPGCLSCS